jgi:hypothetical protein
MWLNGLQSLKDLVWENNPHDSIVETADSSRFRTLTILFRLSVSDVIGEYFGLVFQSFKGIFDSCEEHAGNLVREGDEPQILYHQYVVLDGFDPTRHH